MTRNDWRTLILFVAIALVLGAMILARPHRHAPRPMPDCITRPTSWINNCG